jgi:uncharacterized SAM-dependent methyltransferase
LAVDISQNALDNLEANFDSEFFEHQPEYKESQGIAKSYLVCTKAQEVHIAQFDKTFFFNEGKKYRWKYAESIMILF